MPYDPRMLQMGQYGLGMMSPQQGNPFANQPAGQRPKQWWEQPMPGRVGQSANSPDDTGQSANSPKQPQPSLLQLLMLGGKPTYSGTPTGGGGGGAGSMSPWSWLGSMGMPGGAGWGGSGSGGPG